MLTKGEFIMAKKKVLEVEKVEEVQTIKINNEIVNQFEKAESKEQEDNAFDISKLQYNKLSTDMKIRLIDELVFESGLINYDYDYARYNPLMAEVGIDIKYLIQISNIELGFEKPNELSSFYDSKLFNVIKRELFWQDDYAILKQSILKELDKEVDRRNNLNLTLNNLIKDITQIVSDITNEFKSVATQENLQKVSSILENLDVENLSKITDVLEKADSPKLKALLKLL